MAVGRNILRTNLAKASISTAQYWLVATLANGLLWAQIVIGAALTALGA